MVLVLSMRKSEPNKFFWFDLSARLLTIHSEGERTRKEAYKEGVRSYAQKLGTTQTAMIQVTHTNVTFIAQWVAHHMQKWKMWK